jgi:RHH-type transcriptional regulator, rel operon repressor / antitoxin RelB
MLAVRLDPEMEKELEQLAGATGRSKSFYVREALAAYLEDRAEDLLAVAPSSETSRARIWPT